MPLDLASLKNRCAELPVEYAGETILVYYRPVDVTGEAQKALVQLGIDGRIEPVYAQLQRILIAWDLTINRQPVPLTPEGFVQVGLGIVQLIYGSIIRDVGNPTWVASPPAPIPSFNGSSPTATSATPPTTSTSSSPPDGSTSPPGTSPDSPTPLAAFAGIPGPPVSDGP